MTDAPRSRRNNQGNEWKARSKYTKISPAKPLNHTMNTIIAKYQRQRVEDAATAAATPALAGVIRAAGALILDGEKCQTLSRAVAIHSSLTDPEVSQLVTELSALTADAAIKEEAESLAAGINAGHDVCTRRIERLVRSKRTAWIDSPAYSSPEEVRRRADDLICRVIRDVVGGHALQDEHSTSAKFAEAMELFGYHVGLYAAAKFDADGRIIGLR